MVLPKTRGRKRRFGQDTGPSDRAKESHKKRLRSQSLGAHPLTTLNARPEVPSINIKHRSYYEIVENQNKKKKLEVKETNKRTPPPGFEFVPIGNPDLTSACKEISREQDAMVFIVTGGIQTNALSQQIHRVGHHVRRTIAEQARQAIDDADESTDDQLPPGIPEPIPETQREIDEQADKAIRDLFPRIPHTDRRIIIEHSFKKGVTKKGEPLVGLAPDIQLSRRVQLAVLAHIRHTHTRYDKLLKETSYANARRAVEELCLNTLVKWRGDEETGRDQLDEILREVIVISDSEEDGDDEDPETDSSGVDSGDLAEDVYRPRHHPTAIHPQPVDALQHTPSRDPYLPWQAVSAPSHPRPNAPAYAQEAVRVRPSRRGFKRYQDALSARWDEAKVRVRRQEDEPVMPSKYTDGQQTHTRHEAMYEEYRPSPAVVDDDLQIIPDPRLVNGNSARPLEQPSRMPVRAAVQATVAHRSISDGTQRAASPYADPRYRIQPQRLLVRSNEARDYLVSSIEQTSPLTDPRNHAPGPIFVRALSPRPEHHRPMDNIGIVLDDHSARHLPIWGSGDPGHIQPRNFQEAQPHLVSDTSYRERDHHPRPVHNEQRLPVYNDAYHTRPTLLHQIPSEEIRHYTPTSSRPQMQPPAGPEPNARSYDGAVAEPLYRVERVPPANADHWARMSSPVHFVAQQVHERRDYLAAERNEMRTEPGSELRYPRVIEDYHGPLAVYSRPPAQAQYGRLQERLPRSPATRVEYNEPSDRHSPSANAPNNWPVQPRQGYVHSAPHAQQPQPQAYQAAQLEPAPVFIRRVEHHHPGDGHEQTRRQYDDLVMHDVDASPRYAGEAQRQPIYVQERGAADLPQNDRDDGYSPYPGPGRAEPLPDDAEYRGGYSEQQGGSQQHRYYSRGP